VPVILVKASIFVTTTYGSCVGTSFQVTTPPFTITITDSTPIKLMVGIWYVRVQAITAGITPISDNEKNSIAIGACYGIDCTVAGMPPPSTSTSSMKSTTTSFLMSSVATNTATYVIHTILFSILYIMIFY
jgi:hypothetical protein